jgi:hypothetical protein
MQRTLAGVAFLAAVLLSACGGGGSATSGSSSTAGSAAPSKTADLRRAQQALLTAADLPEEWHGQDRSEDPIVADEFACFGLDQAGAMAQAKGGFFAAGGPILIMAGHVFNRGSHVVTSSVTAYGTEARARSAYQARTETLRTNSVATCLREADEVATGPRLDGIVAAYYLPEKFPHLGDEVKAVDYKIHFAKDKKSLIYVDVVVVRDGRAVSLAFFSSVDSPPEVEAVSVRFVEDIATKFGDRLSAAES